MPYHIKKGSILGSAVPNDGTEYYAGDNIWTNDYSKRKIYSTEEEADTQKATTFTSMGYTYQPQWWKNAIVVSE